MSSAAICGAGVQRAAPASPLSARLSAHRTTLIRAPFRACVGAAEPALAGALALAVRCFLGLFAEASDAPSSL
jgi:hypothetical protein